jgi:transcriptional regulator
MVEKVMSKSEISRALDELRQEIDQIENSAHEDKQRLLALLDTIESQTGSTAEAEVPAHELLSEVSEALTEFEIKHPSITGILNDILVILGNSGI